MVAFAFSTGMRRGSNFAGRKPMQFLTAILLLAVSAIAAPIPWKSANFHGLIVGNSRRADVLRTFGAPNTTQHTPRGEELSYLARGDHKGDLTFRLDRSGTITEIEEAFPIAIPRTRIYNELGKDALTEHYYSAKCAGDALYRDPRGSIELTLFPSRGIALWPDQNGYDFAALQYLARRPGLARAPACVGRR
jgi:hypothetical protein